MDYITFHEKFREIASTHPEAPAIVYKGAVMSFAALDQRSDQIARELSSRGIGSGAIVPIHQECNTEWIAYSLGVMKAGAAYTPVSPSTPPERLAYIRQDSETGTAPSGAFCVYYTSGSTGVPKGVILSHKSLLALCEAHTDLLGLSPGIRGGVQADVGFDSFLLSTLPILYAGGTLYLMDAAERMSLVRIHRFLAMNKIDTVFLTTGLAVEYMKAFDNKSLKALLTGGEAIRTQTRRSYAVYNLYGPTECTVYVTAHKLNADDSGDIPIGKPTGQNRIYLIDGELCVSGPQLASGYLNRPDETAQKFIPNPYYDPLTDSACFSRLYRTGDLAQWTAEGELLYRGRADQMIKISGYRIEPGEVEIALARHPSLSAACVTVKHTPGGEPFLVAYCVSHVNDTLLSPAELNAFLSQGLPFYMIPRYFVLLPKLPMDARTGKVDIAALPEPQ